MSFPPYEHGVYLHSGSIIVKFYLIRETLKTEYSLVLGFENENGNMCFIGL